MNLKISEDLLLEKQELNRLKRFIVDDGHKTELLAHTTLFGLIKGISKVDGDTIEQKDVFKVENIGSNSNAVNILPGKAIDKFGNLITLNVSKTLQIPNNNLWYWLKISYRTVNTEVGSVSIDINGNLTGVDTFFTEVLRGQPNFPTKIKFENSSNGNTQEYEVVEVIDDTTAVLSGSFIAETGMNYHVVGTFTPGYIVPDTDKAIYEYDDVIISLVQEGSVVGVMPVKSDGEEFYLARLRTNGLNVLIEDKRTEFWTTKEGYYAQLISRIANPIIGVESVKWDIATTPRDKNEVNIAWGFRSTNWSIDTTQNKITINSGLGGILKENVLTNYVNGSFDGWRLYTKSGIYYRVVSSNKSGSQLNIVLDYMDPKNFTSGDELWLVPDVEEIEIQSNYDAVTGINNILTERFLFPIHFGQGKIYLRITDSSAPYKYNLKFRYKNNFEYSDWMIFPNDAVGYYSEKSFQPNGIIKTLPADREQKPYNGHATNGFIEIVPNPNNINIVFESIITGDKFGVDHKTLTNAQPFIDLVVGNDRQMQVLHANTLVMANDIFVNLNKVRADGTPCINGNRFIIQIVGTLDLNLRNLRIVTDYVNPTSYELIRNIEKIDTAFINLNQFKQRSGLVMIFSYDGTDWILSISNEMPSLPKNSGMMYFGSLSNFDSSGLGIANDVVGYAICNGNYGTTNMRGFVPVGYNNSDMDYSIPGSTGGQKYLSISNVNLPLHNHTFSGNTDWDGSHQHSVWAGNGTGGGGFDKGVDDDERFYPHPNNDNVSRHSHQFSGVTDYAGTNNPALLDNRMPWKTVVFIQKII